MNILATMAAVGIVVAGLWAWAAWAGRLLDSGDEEPLRLNAENEAKFAKREDSRGA